MIPQFPLVEDALKHAGMLRRLITVVQADRPGSYTRWSVPARGPVGAVDEGLIPPGGSVDEYKTEVEYRPAYVGSTISSGTVGMDATDFKPEDAVEAQSSVWQKLEELFFFARSGERPAPGQDKQTWPGFIQFAEMFGRVVTHHAVDQAAVDTAARSLPVGGRGTIWVPPKAVVERDPAFPVYSLPAEEQVVVGLDLDLVEWVEHVPLCWIRLAQLDPRQRAMLVTAGVLKVLDPRGIFVVKIE